MAKQRGGQSGRSVGRNIQEDPAQDVGTGGAGMQGGAARGGTLGGTPEAGTYGSDAYGESGYGAGGYGGGAYGGGAAGGGAPGAGAYGGAAYGTGAQGAAAQSGAAQSGGAGGAGVIDEAKQKAQQLASQAQEKAGEQVQSGLTSGKSRAADALNTVAQSLYNSSQQLRDQNKGGVGRYFEQAASRVERAANYLQQRDVNQVVDEVESFARRRPAVFLGGAFALGLIGARFLRSSRSKIYGDVPHDKAVVPYRAGYDRQANVPGAASGVADRGSWRGAGSSGGVGASGAAATGAGGLSATGGAGLGTPGLYDETSYGQTDFGGTASGTSGDDRI